MGHHQTRINSISSRVSKVVVVEIRKQTIKIEVIQSPNVVITTTMMVTPSTNVVKGGIPIGSTTNLGNGLSGIST
jgi:hypothetical protein